MFVAIYTLVCRSYLYVPVLCHYLIIVILMPLVGPWFGKFKFLFLFLYWHILDAHNGQRLLVLSPKLLLLSWEAKSNPDLQITRKVRIAVLFNDNKILNLNFNLNLLYTGDRRVVFWGFFLEIQNIIQKRILVKFNLIAIWRFLKFIL